MADDKLIKRRVVVYESTRCRSMIIKGSLIGADPLDLFFRYFDDGETFFLPGEDYCYVVRVGVNGLPIDYVVSAGATTPEQCGLVPGRWVSITPRYDKNGNPIDMPGPYREIADVTCVQYPYNTEYPDGPQIADYTIYQPFFEDFLRVDLVAGGGGALITLLLLAFAAAAGSSSAKGRRLHGQ